jgi:hypothetical protein
MELNHQLALPLRQLRLSGILDTLDIRNQQAIDEQWSYVEFLARLLQDEVERRAQKQLALRIRRAAINTTKTLEDFDFRFNPTINRQAVLQVATCDYIYLLPTSWGCSLTRCQVAAISCRRCQPRQRVVTPGSPSDLRPRKPPS